MSRHLAEHYARAAAIRLEQVWPEGTPRPEKINVKSDPGSGEFTITFQPPSGMDEATTKLYIEALRLANKHF